MWCCDRKSLRIFMFSDPCGVSLWLVADPRIWRCRCENNEHHQCRRLHECCCVVTIIEGKCSLGIAYTPHVKLNLLRKFASFSLLQQIQIVYCMCGVADTTREVCASTSAEFAVSHSPWMLHFRSCLHRRSLMYTVHTHC